jgi:hypothetical protein
MADMYRKTANVEAYQYPFSGDVPQEFKDALWHPADGRIFIGTLEGDMEVTLGSWICKGSEGEFWAIKDSIFQATYEKVSD